MDIASIWAFILLVVGFGFVIFVHELGHFAVAKWVGIKVEQFAIGFGPKLIGFQPKNSETEYRINILPLGGYVKMLGQEDLDPNATSTDPNAYNNKPIWARMSVVSAGVVMNLIFGVIFFVGAFLHGVEFPPAEVGLVQPGSPAATTPAVNDPEIIGLQPGDQILHVNGKKPSDFTELQIASALAAEGAAVDLRILRPGFAGQQERELHFLIEPVPDPQTVQAIGVAPPMSLKLGRPLSGEGGIQAIFDRYGLQPGMRLIEVDGEPVEAFWQYEELLAQSAGDPITLTFADLKEEKTKSITIVPRTNLPSVDDNPPNLLGLVPPVKIETVMPDGAAAGVLEEGDLVVKLGDQLWPTVDQLISLVSQSPGEEMPVVVLRDGERLELTVTPRQVGNKGMIGVYPVPATDTALVAGVLEASPFGDLQLVPGSRIESVGGKRVENYSDLRKALTSGEPGEVSVTYQMPIDGGIEEQAPVVVSQEQIVALSDLAWVSPIPMLAFEPQAILQQASGPWEATVIGFQKTGLFLKQTYITLLRLLQGIVSVQDLSGPVGIARIGTKTAERGWAYLLFFLGLISVNLAVINFLPLPIVDGGLFVLLVIEKIRRKPLPAQLQSAITIAGLLLLGTLFIVVTISDIMKWMGS